MANVHKQPESLSLSEAGRILGMSYHSMYSKVKAGVIPAIQVPANKRTTWRIPKDTIKSMLEGGLPRG